MNYVAPPGETASRAVVIEFAERLYIQSGLRELMRRNFLMARRLPPESDPARRQAAIDKYHHRVDSLWVGLITNALLNQPLHRRRVYDVFAHGDTPQHIRDKFDFTEVDGVRQRDTHDKRVDRAFNELCDALDPASADDAQAAENLYGELVALCGDLLALTWRLMPRWMRRAYRGDLTVDGTPIGTWGCPGSISKIPKVPRPPDAATREGELITEQLTRLHDDRSDDPLALPPSAQSRTTRLDTANPLAGYYVREDGAKWGYEAHLVITTNSERKNHSRGLPSMVLSVGLFTPACAVADVPVLLVKDLQRLGLPARHLAADTPIGHTAAERFALPMRQLGYELLIPLHSNVAGPQGSWGPAVIVDGDLYSHAIPDELRTLTPRYNKSVADIVKDEKLDTDQRKKLIDEATAEYRQALADREIYRLIIEEWDSDGIFPTRVACPANALAQRATCPNSPNSITRGRKKDQRAAAQTKGRRPIPLVAINTPAAVTDLCKQARVSLNRDDPGALVWLRNHRPVPVGTGTFKKLYNQARNTSEGVNGHAKDIAFEALESNQVRRAHGLAANMLLATLQILASNLRRLRNYLTEEDERQRLAAGGAVSRKYTQATRSPAYGPHGSIDTQPGDADQPDWFTAPYPNTG